MQFTLKDLPYSKNALAPHISEETMDFHHSKHLQAYVNNANNLISGTEFEGKSIEDIIKGASGALFNNVAQIANHEFFWEVMSPNGGGAPKGDVLTAIEKQFGSFDEFKSKFTTAATTLFGSGWAWLAKNDDGSLEILQLSNAGNPISLGKKPIIGLDVWEHSYYIDYRNKRPEYISHFWDLVNWDFVRSQL